MMSSRCWSWVTWVFEFFGFDDDCEMSRRMGQHQTQREMGVKGGAECGGCCGCWCESELACAPMTIAAVAAACAAITLQQALRYPQPLSKMGALMRLLIRASVYRTRESSRKLRCSRLSAATEGQISWKCIKFHPRLYCRRIYRINPPPLFLH
jgi:hypothetical protein